jgi:hypothetical protein
MKTLASFLDGDWPDAPAMVRVRAGAAVGSVFMIFLPVIAFLWWREGTEYVSRDGRSMRLDLLSLLYPFGTVVTGSLFFLLAGVSQARLAKACLGALAFLPWMAALALCINDGYQNWRGVHTAITLLTAVAFGCPLGWNASSLTTRSRESKSAEPAV